MKSIFRPVFYIILSVVLLSACRSKKYEERIAALEQELSASNQLLATSDSTMELIAVMLDSVETNERMLSTNIATANSENQDSILLKIEGARAYIAYSKSEIERLEGELEKAANENNITSKKIRGLSATIRRLKKELQTKEDSLITLNEKIIFLEEDNTVLASTIQQQKSTLTQQEQTIAKQEQTLEQRADALRQKEEALAMQERATQMQEAEKFFALGKQEEMLADKTRFAAKKKKRLYLSAERYYQQAYELGKPDAKEAMYNAKKKAIKVKFAGDVEIDN